MPISHKLISINDENEWKNSLNDVPHLYTHTHWYNFAMHLATQREIYLYEGKGHDFHVICPLYLRRRDQYSLYDITTPYGFSGFACRGEYENFFQEWQTFMLEQKIVCGHIALHPLLNSTLNYHEPDRFATKPMYMIDLNRPLETIFDSFATDHRQRLRKWQKKQYNVTIEKSAHYRTAFIALYQHSIKQRHAARVYDFGEQAWQALLDSPHSLLISVEDKGEIQSTAIFLHDQKLIDYFMLASTDAGRQHTRGIIWHAIEYAQSHAYDWMNLGCGVKADDALTQFKSHFGSVPMMTYALKQIYQPNIYQQLCQQYQTNSVDLTGFFPSYWHIEV